MHAGEAGEVPFSVAAQCREHSSIRLKSFEPCMRRSRSMGTRSSSVATLEPVLCGSKLRLVTCSVSLHCILDNRSAGDKVYLQTGFGSCT